MQKHAASFRGGGGVSSGPRWNWGGRFFFFPFLSPFLSGGRSDSRGGCMSGLLKLFELADFCRLSWVTSLKLSRRQAPLPPLAHVTFSVEISGFNVSCFVLPSRRQCKSYTHMASPPTATTHLLSDFGSVYFLGPNVCSFRERVLFKMLT